MKGKLRLRKGKEFVRAGWPIVAKAKIETQKSLATKTVIFH